MLITIIIQIHPRIINIMKIIQNFQIQIIISQIVIKIFAHHHLDRMIQQIQINIEIQQSPIINLTIIIKLMELINNLAIVVHLQHMKHTDRHKQNRQHFKQLQILQMERNRTIIVVVAATFERQ